MMPSVIAYRMHPQPTQGGRQRTTSANVPTSRTRTWGYANGTLEVLNASFIFVVYALTSFPFAVLSS
ncbi:hypothetical protein BDM02DRAFT_3121078 [Thelephora ganbajun]|uniref:Uncharacterized protein n=1 Tax=Thelephora ganbajun TaxID=370292 RepID=A0ACB6Z5R1_THEGA|nr:hypothetical protein BDM02DRAFT_3121078 [Thelephora ganbajun]